MKCLILAGGSGDRLWPLSRRSYPKQFVEIKEKRSFLQETILRNMPFCDEFLIVTNEKYRFIVEGQLQAFQGLKVKCYFEEISRGTAVPITLLSMLQDPSELLMVTAADMAVGSNGYRESIIAAQECAKEGNITIMGLPITEASTRYGYIKCNENIYYSDFKGNIPETVFEEKDIQCDSRGIVYGVEKFIEKPQEREAAQFAENGRYLWNSGMFLTESKSFLQQLELCQSDLYNECKSICNRLKSRSKEIVFGKCLYEKLPNISVERALFEKSSDLKVLRSDFEWQDMDALEDVLPYTKRDEINTIINNNNCENVNVVNRTGRQLVVANDISDIMVINTPDVVYVSGKDASVDSVLELMSENENRYASYFNQGQLIYQPWGHYEVLSQENGFKVRKLTVFPGMRTPMQAYSQRSIHWSIASGNARVDLDDNQEEYLTNDSIYIEKGTLHSVFNCGLQNLIIVEVAIGEEIADNNLSTQPNEELLTEDLQKENIIRLKPAYKDYMWGGTGLKKVFNKKSDYDIIAESWELSAHLDGQSTIAEGIYKGMSFGQYLKRMGKDILGWKADLYEEFPVLIKLIDANNSLSIQVHPDDDFAMTNEGEYGKNEAWHIIDCEPHSYIYCGFREEVTKEQILKAVEDEKLIDLLNKYEVEKGDTIFIPAGTVHAIGAGILLCEVQQNSNSTYRLYDFGRRDKYGRTRELHLEKALNVIDTSKWSDKNIHHSNWEKIEGGYKDYLVQCKYFEIIKFKVDDEVEIQLDDTSFSGINFLSGKGLIATQERNITALAGDTFFVPAGQMSISIKGNCQFLLTRI